jgi:nitrate/TMAO reductase-like tetraheme cytochrome c subunit
MMVPMEDSSSSEGDKHANVRVPSLLQNYVSLGGISIVLASLTGILLLLLIQLTRADTAPYLGILTYILLPAGLVFGLAVVALGVMGERWRRRKSSPEEIAAYPILDLSGPRRRRKFLAFVFVTVLFLFMTAFASYQGFEYTESVEFCGIRCHTPMKPEYTTYLAGAHARVRCVDCHVGSGADWYVRSKLSGAYQLYSVMFNKYSRPIATPVHNLRPAPETCEQCHWPEKFFGAQMKVFNKFDDDERNTPRQVRMLINVGGGSPATGNVTGIHWHMNIANEVTYISTDEQRQQIPWVRIKDRNGNVTEYHDPTQRLSPKQIAESQQRRMDCVDCHNRPAHVFLPPEVSVDQAFAAGKLDTELPYLKQRSVALLSGEYNTTDQALEAINAGLQSYYGMNYPDVYTRKAAEISGAVATLQSIFQTYHFPEMRTDWRTHINNIGHYNAAGCFRCHSGRHVSDTGKLITTNCDICHTTIYDSQGPPQANARTGPFVHPVDLGSLASRRCDTCHVAGQPFVHPINLGDISRFQCVECHQRK